MLMHLNGLAFGAPRGSAAPVKASYAPLFTHLGLVASPASICRRSSSSGSSMSRRCSAEAGAGMTTFNDLNEGGRRVAEHRSIPRVVVGLKGWELAARTLCTKAVSPCSGSGPTRVPCIWRCSTSRKAMSPSSATNAPDGRYPSIAAHHPPAIRLERAIRDLFGHEAEGLPDARPWLDHGRWGTSTPLGDVPRPRREAASAYPFLRSDGEKSASDSGGPGPRGHHRAGPFPFHRVGRDGGQARGTSWLCPQGH